MEFAVESLETPALTKAQLAELLFEQIGLNKRESKDMIDAFFDLISASLVDGKDVKISGFGNFQIRTKAPRPGATRAPARPSRSRRGAWSPSTPATSSRNRSRATGTGRKRPRPETVAATRRSRAQRPPRPRFASAHLRVTSKLSLLVD
jgi:integration host factor subunit alpha